MIVATRAIQPEDSNTLWAQGGIIYEGVHDSPADLEKDILRAGAGHSYPKAVAILAEEGPPTLKRVLAGTRGRAVRPNQMMASYRWRWKGATRCRASCTWPTTPAKRSSWR